MKRQTTMKTVAAALILSALNLTFATAIDAADEINPEDFTARIRTSTETLTQSGLLAELLQQQRRKAIRISQCHAQREQVRGFFRNNLASLLRRAHDITAGRGFHRGFGEATVRRHT